MSFIPHNYMKLSLKTINNLQKVAYQELKPKSDTRIVLPPKKWKIIKFLKTIRKIQTAAKFINDIMTTFLTAMVSKVSLLCVNFLPDSGGCPKVSTVLQ